MNRKQMAYRIISAQADALAFDMDCGVELRSKDELVEATYKYLLCGRRAEHFKFLTSDWIKETISKELDRAFKKWGVEIH